MDKIAMVADLYDELAMKIYEVNKEADNVICYLEALTFALNLLNGTEERIDPPYVALIERIEKIPLNQEELRRALFLNEIKAFKDLGLNLDEITPDAIALIIGMIMVKKPKMTILDLGLGLGNLSKTIANIIKDDLVIIGIEQNQMLCTYLEAYANLAQIKMEIHMEDLLLYQYHLVDAIVGDLTNYQYENEYYDSPLYQMGVRDFVYLAIEKHLDSGNDNCLAYYLVDENFFSLPNSTKFKECFTKKAFIKAIITLPPSFFKAQGKFILVVAKRQDGTNQDTAIYRIPDIANRDQVQKMIYEINKNLEN